MNHFRRTRESQRLRETLFGQPSVIEFTHLAPVRNYQKKLTDIHELSPKLGVPGKMEIINPPENISKNQIRAILKDIRSKRFRPRLVDGKTTESSIVFPYSSNQTQGYIKIAMNIMTDKKTSREPDSWPAKADASRPAYRCNFKPVRLLDAITNQKWLKSRRR